MARVIILKYLLVKALATPPPEYLAECQKRWTSDEWNKFLEELRSRDVQLIDRLRQNGLWSEMEQKERNFMEAQPTEVTRQAIVDTSWSVESIVCLLWALGYLPELPPYDQQADHELANMLPMESAKVLIRKAVLRPHESIRKQRDLAELWHW